ncbi:hypothetical protein VNI00_015953 [Paramarasmius palmivorus]|uniref:F-box domain-containing protein n=1 Tax=Paramarasmius palmivorus TaxID=297713 RepID=A0AAW0BHZ2_9AGAR
MTDVTQHSVIQPLFERVPTGAIKPSGWALDQANVQAEGLAGNIWDFGSYVKGSIWVEGGSIEYSEMHEAAPYWLSVSFGWFRYSNGAVSLAFQLGDERLISRVRNFLDWNLGNQQDDGRIGPEALDPNSTTPRLTWPRYLVLLGLIQYAEVDPTQSERIKNNKQGSEDLGFQFGYQYHPALSSEDELTTETGKEDELLETMQLLRDRGFSWENDWFTDANFPKEAVTSGFTHQTRGVNTAEALKSEALAYRFTADPTDRQSTFDRIDMVAYFFVNDFPSDFFPKNGALYGCGANLFSCDSVQHIWEQLCRRSSGDAWCVCLDTQAWRRLLTSAAGWWSHQYDQQANQIWAKVMDPPPWGNNGPNSNVFGFEPNYPCCTVNHPQAYPKFWSHAFFKDTSDSSIIHAFLGPAVYEDDIGPGVSLLTLVIVSHILILHPNSQSGYSYPFGTTLTYDVTATTPFTLKVRVPECAKQNLEKSTIQVNDGEASPLQPNVNSFHVVLEIGATGVGQAYVRFKSLTHTTMFQVAFRSPSLRFNTAQVALISMNSALEVGEEIVTEADGGTEAHTRIAKVENLQEERGGGTIVEKGIVREDVAGAEIENLDNNRRITGAKTILILPTETLGIILTLLQHHDVLRLSWTSQRLREVAKGNAALWTKPNLELREQLLEYIIRAKNLPMSFCLLASPSLSMTQTQVAVRDSLREIMNRHALKQARELKLPLFSDTMWFIPELGHSAPCLECLDICCLHPESGPAQQCPCLRSQLPPRLFRGNSPRLRSLTLRFPLWEPDWSHSLSASVSVSTLDLRLEACPSVAAFRPRLVEFLEMLRAAPQLISLGLIGCPPQVDPTINATADLSLLESIELQGMTLAEVFGIIQSLYIPSVKKYKLFADDSSAIDRHIGVEEIRTFKNLFRVISASSRGLDQISELRLAFRPSYAFGQHSGIQLMLSGRTNSAETVQPTCVSVRWTWPNHPTSLSDDVGAAICKVLQMFSLGSLHTLTIAPGSLAMTSIVREVFSLAPITKLHIIGNGSGVIELVTTLGLQEVDGKYVWSKLEHLHLEKALLNQAGLEEAVYYGLNRRKEQYSALDVITLNCCSGYQRTLEDMASVVDTIS